MYIIPNKKGHQRGGLLLRREVPAGENPGTGFGVAGVSGCSRRGRSISPAPA